MTMHQRGQGRIARLLGVATAALFVLVWSSTSPTLSAWTSGVVTNSTSTTAPASMVFSHSAGACSLGPRVSATATCAATPTPLSASAAGAVTGTDVLTNGGTMPAAGLTQTVSGASCATVQLTNRVAAARVMLPRYGTGFLASDPWAGTNAVTMDGTAYAASVTSQTLISNDSRIASLGVWFKAASG